MPATAVGIAIACNPGGSAPAARGAALGFPRLPPTKSAAAHPRRAACRPRPRHTILTVHSPPPLGLRTKRQSPPPLPQFRSSSHARLGLSRFATTRSIADDGDPMDAAAVDATPLGAWAAVRGYFTPATLFLLLNLVIGTIALTSRSHQRRRRELHHDYAHHHHQQEPHVVNDPHQRQEYHYYQQQPQYATTQPPPPEPLARTSSVMDRLRSIGLYRFRSGDFPPEYGSVASHDVPFAPVVEEETTTTEQAAHYARSRSEPAPVEKIAPPRVMKKKSGNEAVIIGSLRQQEPSSPQRAEYHQFQEEHVPPPAPMRAPPPLSRTSSVLDRLRSLGLYSFLGAEQPAAAATPPPPGDPRPAGDRKKPAAQAHYDRSRSEPAAREQGKKEKKQVAAEARMGKSTSSTARKPAASSRLVAEDCVDARAEAFIDSFRKEQSQKQQVVVVHHEDEDDNHVVPPPPAPLARTSSVLDRLRSFSLYLRSADPVPDDPVSKASAADEKKQQAQYGRSRSEPAREQGRKKKQQQGAGTMNKSSSEAKKIAEEAAPGEECVDARADDFINKFRQQLQLQRLNSLLSYKQQ